MYILSQYSFTRIALCVKIRLESIKTSAKFKKTLQQIMLN